MPTIATWMWFVALAALFVIASLVFRVKVNVKVNGIQFHDLRATSMEAHERIGEYLRSNYSGDPAALGPALHGLLPAVREIASRHGMTLDDDLLRTVVVTSVATHHAATRAQAEAAFEAALHSERGAA